MTGTSQGIVVGVTGGGENTDALAWAVEEARLRELPVTLLHAVEPLLPPPPPSVLLSYEELQTIGQQLADEAAHELAAMVGDAGGPAWTSTVRRGYAPALLTEVSDDADLVVLAHRHLSELRRIVTGSTTVAVAAHAGCPVISVPVGWTPPVDGSGVTVGVHESGAPMPVLEAGFELAALHGWPLRLVHAWRVDPCYDEIIEERIGHDWDGRVGDELRTAVEPLVGKYPDVPVEVVVRHQWPADALVELSASSRMVVVGRHGARPLLPQRIGSIARTILRKAHSPVMVVPV